MLVKLGRINVLSVKNMLVIITAPLRCRPDSRRIVAGVEATVEGDRGRDGRVRSFGHHQLQDAEYVIVTR